MKHSELRRQPRHVNPRIQGRSEVFDFVIVVILSTIPVLVKPNLKENYICEVGKILWCSIFLME